MTLQLPQPLGRYFELGNSEDHASIADCFSDTAKVKDEGQWRRGKAEILNWVIHTRQAYQYRAEPLSFTQEGDFVLVTARLTGNFPGSPIVLRYRFGLAGDQIVHLEIAP